MAPESLRDGAIKLMLLVWYGHYRAHLNLQSRMTCDEKKYRKIQIYRTKEKDIELNF